MDVLLSDEFKSRVEDELAELADKRRNENDKRLKEEHDAQMQQQGAKDAHKEEPDAQTQTPHKPHLVDAACTEEGSKKGQGKGKAKTTWQGDTQQGVGLGWVDTSGGDEWTGWGGTKGGGSRTEEGSKKGQGKGKAKTTWQGDTQQGVGPGWVDTSGGDEGWTGWGGTKGGGSRNEEWSKKGQGKGKANTTWQGDTQQGVGPGWVDTSGGDEGWTGWGGTKGGGSKGKGRKETTSPWADDWWQDWGTNQDREYPREAQQGMARSQWGNGNDIMQNRKRMRTWDGHNNGWKGSGKGTNGCDWMPIDPRLIEEGTRAQV
jgi:hypothetical protein